MVDRRAKQLILATSHSPASRSFALAKRFHTAVEGLGDRGELIRVKDLELPMCDGGPCYEDPEVQALSQKVRQADAVTIATPIYNFEVGGATRNLIALTGNAWSEKVVGFLCAAGGPGSQMAVMGLANSLMLDFRSFVVPHFVFATEEAFAVTKIVADDVAQRIEELAREMHRVATALVR